MKNPFKKNADSAAIEGELKRLADRKADTERRRSELLQSLEEAKAARRAVLDGEQAAIDAASAKVRALTAEAADLAEMIEELESAISAATDRFRTAADAERRRAAALELEKISSAVQAHQTDLEKAVAALAKVARSMIASIPGDMGIAPGAYARRPEDRKENGMLTGREMVAAVIADALAEAAPDLFDDFRDSGYRRALFCLTDKSEKPAYGSSTAPESPLAAGEAIRMLITERLKARAAAILQGEQAPSLGGAEYRQEPAPAVETIELVSLKNLTIVLPSVFLPEKQIMPKGRSHSFPKPVIGKLLATKAFAPVGSDEALKIRAEIEAGPRRGMQPGIDFEQCTDLGDPMGLLDAEREEAERAVA